MRNVKKYIFVGNFRTFRGLEHSRITIIVDRDIYSLQHYLVECIARCTTYLNIVLFGVNNVKWKKGIKGNPLIKSWKIVLSKDKQQSNKIWEMMRSQLKKVIADIEKYQIITTDTFSQEYKKLEKTFNETSFQENEEEDIILMRAVKIAIER